jgi:tetratricopeptide (TPR) repeat protein
MSLSEYAKSKWQNSLTLRKKGAFQDAEEELKAALEEQPDHPLLKASLAQLYLRQDRLKEARILVESILSMEPEYVQGLYVLGEIYLCEDNMDDALRCFRQASQKDPRPYLLHSVVKTLRKMGHYDEALEAVDSALISHRDSLRLLKEKALILDRMKLPDEALRTYERIKELHPDDPYTAKAIYKLRSLRRPDEEVIRELEKVLSLPSRRDNAQLHGLLGEKLKKSGRPAQAAEAFKRASELAPNNLFFQKQEGYCRYQLKEYPEAVRLLGEAFRKDPTDYILKSTLRRIHSSIGDMDGFVQLLEDILKEHPHNVKIMGTLRGLKKK